MLENRKLAKTYIMTTTRSEFEALIDEAFLTERQEAIIKAKRATNAPTWVIANDLNVSPETITQELTVIYERVSHIIK